MRVAQPEGTRGSLKWIQRAVEQRPDLLQPSGLPEIEWLSPLRDDDFAEYRDGAFLDRLELSHLSGALAEFWPKRGPQWDALGRADDRIVVVEAKAHVEEFLSPATQASAKSRAQIERAFDRVRADIGVSNQTRWTEVLFQYANRLAHLWFLRRLGAKAELLFVDFLNDDEMNGPASAEVWQAAFAVADHALGLNGRHKLTPYVHHVYPDVSLLS